MCLAHASCLLASDALSSARSAQRLFWGSRNHLATYSRHAACFPRAGARLPHCHFLRVLLRPRNDVSLFSDLPALQHPPLHTASQAGTHMAMEIYELPLQVLPISLSFGCNVPLVFGLPCLFGMCPLFAACSVVAPPLCVRLLMRCCECTVLCPHTVAVSELRYELSLSPYRETCCASLWKLRCVCFLVPVVCSCSANDM
jgi:hypothetical protein